MRALAWAFGAPAALRARPAAGTAPRQLPLARGGACGGCRVRWPAGRRRATLRAGRRSRSASGGRAGERGARGDARRGAGGPRPASPPPSRRPARASPRDPGPAGRDDLVDLLAERLADYRASVTRAPAGPPPRPSGASWPRAGARRVGRPARPARRRCARRGSRWSRTTASPRASSTRLDGALTGCPLAIAETGTLVLDGGPAQGRRALSLVPDLHVCVVAQEQIVATMPEAIGAAGRAAAARRPLTLISGPSATSTSSCAGWRASTVRGGSTW